MNAKHKKWRVIFAAILVMMASRAFAEIHVNGEWVAQSKAGVLMTLHFFEGGLWEFDINGDQIKDMWGKYKVRNDKITLTTTGGKELCASPKKAGIYKLQLNGPQLTFIEISDDCAPRVDNFSLFWTQQ